MGPAYASFRNIHAFFFYQLSFVLDLTERCIMMKTCPSCLSPSASADEILDKVKCEYYNDTKDWYVRFDKKEDLPKRFHYSNNIRIEEVIGEVQTQFLAFR